MWYRRASAVLWPEQEGPKTRYGLPEDAMTPSRAPVALVTGANKGIGFEVARGIAKAGYTVLLGARNSTSGREAADILTGERLHGPTGKFLETCGELVW